MRPLLLSALLFFTLPAVEAAEIRLADGSMVFGTILQLSDGADLAVDTAHMGEVIIEWAAIESVANTNIVSVELYDGRRFDGTIRRKGPVVEITSADGVAVDASAIYWIEEHTETFWEGFNANMDLGMNLVRGNNQVTQVSVGAGVGFDSARRETSLGATTIVNNQQESGDTRRSTLLGSYTRKFSNGWQTIGSLQFESDEQQGLDGRTLLAAALGRRVLNQRHHRLELFAGIAANSERFDGIGRNDSMEALLGSRYRMRSFADIDTTLLVLPNLDQSDRLRVQFDAAASFDLYSELDFKIVVYDRYDSQPPPGNEKHDTGLTLGLSWSY